MTNAGIDRLLADLRTWSAKAEQQLARVEIRPRDYLPFDAHLWVATAPPTNSTSFPSAGREHGTSAVGTEASGMAPRPHPLTD